MPGSAFLSLFLLNPSQSVPIKGPVVKGPSNGPRPLAPPRSHSLSALSLQPSSRKHPTHQTHLQSAAFLGRIGIRESFSLLVAPLWTFGSLGEDIGTDPAQLGSALRILFRTGASLGAAKATPRILREELLPSSLARLRYE